MRMVPTQQRFRSKELARAEVELGLVVQHELSGIDCFAEEQLGVGSFCDLDAQDVVEGVDLVPASPLRPVERRIGLGEEILGCRDVWCGRRDPDACRPGDQVTGDLHRCRDGGADVIGDRSRVGVELLIDEDDELVSGEPADEVAGRAVAEPVGHGRQETVARGMTEGVVQRLEAVEVHEQQRRRACRPGRAVTGARPSGPGDSAGRSGRRDRRCTGGAPRRPPGPAAGRSATPPLARR